MGTWSCGRLRGIGAFEVGPDLIVVGRRRWGPGWIYAKLLIWLIAGGLMGFIPRKPALAKPMWFIVIALGGLASILGVTKPF